jgi:hypothetical protein
LNQEGFTGAPLLLFACGASCIAHICGESAQRLRFCRHPELRDPSESSIASPRSLASGMLLPPKRGFGCAESLDGSSSDSTPSSRELPAQGGSACY